jgi:hypothetical protein
MRPSNRDLLRLHAEATERRLKVGDLTGTEFVLAGGGVVWIADCAPDWAVGRMLESAFRDEVQAGFGDGMSVRVLDPSSEVDL